MTNNEDNGLGFYRCVYCQKKRFVGNLYPCKAGRLIDWSPTPWGVACKPARSPMPCPRCNAPKMFYVGFDPDLSCTSCYWKHGDPVGDVVHA